MCYSIYNKSKPANYIGVKIERFFVKHFPKGFDLLNGKCFLFFS